MQKNPTSEKHDSTGKKNIVKLLLSKPPTAANNSTLFQPSFRGLLRQTLASYFARRVVDEACWYSSVFEEELWKMFGTESTTKFYHNNLAKRCVAARGWAEDRALWGRPFKMESFRIAATRGLRKTWHPRNCWNGSMMCWCKPLCYLKTPENSYTQAGFSSAVKSDDLRISIIVRCQNQVAILFAGM